MENGNQNSSKDSGWWQGAVNLFGEVTGLMVVPIVAGLYGGRALDARYGTEPWWFITCSVAGLAIASVSVARIAARYIAREASNSQTDDTKTKF